ncbi:MAG: FAD-binding oxidoreductase [Thermodesulfobacteriota bacterium]
MQQTHKKLTQIVGQDFVSNHPEELYMYSMDPGTMPPCPPDYVVMPQDTEQVQNILLLANTEGMPVYCMGAGLVLSGLTRPLQGGIVMDMKRMNRILEVNPNSRYAVVEAGVTQGMLQAYLQKHHPGLKHSMPDAPPMATIAGNILIHGSGHLSQFGFHSEMLNGLEVVLPTAEIVKTGACSVSPYWFSRAPLPDLSGLFIGWSGTTGVATKLAIKLYPNYPYNDVSILVTHDVQLMPDILYRITQTHLAEDLMAWMTPVPAWARGFQHLNIHFGAQSRKELTWKRNLLQASVQEYRDQKKAGFMMLPSFMRERFMEVPDKGLARFADVKKGGGFEYVGGIMPIELFPQAYYLGLKIAKEYQIAYSLGSRIVGPGHCMMFFYAYAFNRADPADMEQAHQALQRTNQEVLEMGGIPWKAEEPAQKNIIDKMDPNSFALMNRIRAVLDPKGIMGPGNWEA